jgi:hypothetical protein
MLVGTWPILEKRGEGEGDELSVTGPLADGWLPARGQGGLSYPSAPGSYLVATTGLAFILAPHDRLQIGKIACADPFEFHGY